MSGGKVLFMGAGDWRESGGPAGGLFRQAWVRNLLNHQLGDSHGSLISMSWIELLIAGHEVTTGVALHMHPYYYCAVTCCFKNSYSTFMGKSVAIWDEKSGTVT